MKADPNDTIAVGHPFWQPDARERLVKLLPELVLSVVAATCMSTVMNYSKDISIVPVLGAMTVVQLFTQIVMYASVYLVFYWDRGQALFTGFFGLLVAVMGVYAFISFSFFGGYGGTFIRFLNQASLVAVMVGISLFLFTRARWTFVFLLLEVLVLSSETGVVGSPTGIHVIHFVGACATLALYVLRCSATRMTVSYVAEVKPIADVDDEIRGGFDSLGIYGQVAAVAAGIGVLLLAVVLAGVPLWKDGSDTASVAPISSGVANRTEERYESADIDDGGDDASTTVADTPVTEPVKPVETPAAVDEGRAESPDLSWLSVLIPVLLLAALILPIPMRLLARWFNVRSIEGELRGADRVARIYLGCLDRLEAAGISRDEAETPQEFLDRNYAELCALTEPAGFGIDEWVTLTEAYGKARYAELDPTESELGTCLKVFEALPACIREKDGWFAYYTGAFWHM